MLVKKPIGWFQPDPDNPRKAPEDSDPRKPQWEADLDRLGDDMLARGVLVPLLARPTGLLVDGWRRWLAAQRKSIPDLPVIITDKPEEEIAGIRLATVFHKADLTAFEKARACADILAAHPGWQMKDLAAFLHLDPSSVTRWCSPSRCSPAWQQALKDGRVGISDCYAASKLPHEQQEALLAMKLAGASRDAIEQAGRAARNQGGGHEAPPERCSRVKIPLAVSTKEISAHGTVTLTSLPGREIDLKEAENLLKEALKAVRDASGRGLGVKAAQAGWRDVAKKAANAQKGGASSAA